MRRASECVAPGKQDAEQRLYLNYGQLKGLSLSPASSLSIFLCCHAVSNLSSDMYTHLYIKNLLQRVSQELSVQPQGFLQNQTSITHCTLATHKEN